jgi:16S rRNA (uracil1498-N3)-methyltransferase
MSAPRFFLPDAQHVGEQRALSDDEAHHLRHVLRLGAGAPVVVFDGRGREWRARVARVEKRGPVTVELLDESAPAPEPRVSVTLGLALLKGEQMDAVVRDATALGVAAIVPFRSAHVAVPSKLSKAAPVERWQRVAVAAAKQCGRAVVPVIDPVASFDAVIGRGRELGACVIAVEPALARHDDRGVGDIAPPQSALVLVGPEGGWAGQEIDQARDCGAVAISLGPRRLTAELAPVVVLSALRAAWGW